METTTVRVHKTTREKLKKISASENVSVTELIDRLVEEHEGSFWRGFENEAASFMDKEEKRSRKTFEKVLRDGLAE